MAKCSSSISTSFAYVFLISSLFALCFFSFYYFPTDHIVLDIHGLISKNLVVNSTTAPAPTAGAVEVEVEVEVDEDSPPTAEERDLAFPPKDVPREERIAWFKQRVPRLRILKSTARTQMFDQRVKDFLDNQGTNTTTSTSTNSTRSCEVRFFMTWIAPASQFGKREFNSLESVLKSHPNGCVVILSRGLDSDEGAKVLEPLLKLGYRVFPVTPDLPFLASDTPAQAWLEGLKNGTVDPGKIPITQNLSNLLRILVLYKYGGIYLDVDVIIIKDMSKLRNSIGVQSVNDDTQTWKTLNNAVMIFDKEHPLLLKFLEEFATNFDGSVWGHNGPYMVTRVVMQVVDDSRFDFNILSYMAFYPVDWLTIGDIFERPKSKDQAKKDKEKLDQFDRECYGVHLWNKMSRNLKIQQKSIVGRLISDHCILCRDVYDLDDGGKPASKQTTLAANQTTTTS